MNEKECPIKLPLYKDYIRTTAGGTQLYSVFDFNDKLIESLLIENQADFIILACNSHFEQAEENKRLKIDVTFWKDKYIKLRDYRDPPL